MDGELEIRTFWQNNPADPALDNIMVNTIKHEYSEISWLFSPVKGRTNERINATVDSFMFCGVIASFPVACHINLSFWGTKHPSPPPSLVPSHVATQVSFGH